MSAGRIKPDDLVKFYVEKINKHFADQKIDGKLKVEISKPDSALGETYILAHPNEDARKLIDTILEENGIITKKTILPDGTKGRAIPISSLKLIAEPVHPKRPPLFFETPADPVYREPPPDKKNEALQTATASAFLRDVVDQFNANQKIKKFHLEIRNMSDAVNNDAFEMTLEIKANTRPGETILGAAYTFVLDNFIREATQHNVNINTIKIHTPNSYTLQGTVTKEHLLQLNKHAAPGGPPTFG